MPRTLQELFLLMFLVILFKRGKITQLKCFYSVDSICNIIFSADMLMFA